MSIARHTSYNLAGALLPIAVSLVLTPMLVGAIGVARYGLFSIYLVLLGYFGLFDFGTGRAVGQRIASLRGERRERRNRPFWTSLTICLCLCLVAAAIVAAAVPLIARFLDTANSELAAELHSALYWLVLAVPLAMLSSQFTGALEGAEQFAFVNLVNVVTSVTLLALPLLAAFMISPELDVLAAAATAGRLVSLLGLIVGGAVLLPVRRPQFDPQDVRKLLAFGGWTTISNVVGPILLMFDRFLIGRLLNSAAIGVYALPYSVMTQLQILPTAINRTLFPRIASGTDEEAAATSLTAIALLNSLVTCALVIAAPILLPFLRFWVGAQIGTAASPVAYALIPGIWANSLAMVSATALQAKANTRFLALVHLSEIVPYLVLLYMGIHFLGVAGAALAWSARCMADALIIFSCQKVSLDKFATLFSGIGLTAVTLVLLVLPWDGPLRWLLLVLIGAPTFWQAWHSRPAIARSYQQEALAGLRRMSWLR